MAKKPEEEDEFNFEDDEAAFMEAAMEAEKELTSSQPLPSAVANASPADSNDTPVVGVDGKKAAEGSKGDSVRKPMDDVEKTEVDEKEVQKEMNGENEEKNEDKNEDKNEEKGGKEKENGEGGEDGKEKKEKGDEKDIAMPALEAPQLEPEDINADAEPEKK